MKKAILIVIFLLLSFCHAEALKGGVSDTYMPMGFLGSWGVISKLESSNNPDVFNYESRDIWTLSAIGNKMVLENLESGAYSEIILQQKTDGNSLVFQREKTVKKNGIKTVYREKVSFKLNGNNFSGTDIFEVERYNSQGVKTRTDVAKYHCAGVKISRNN